MLTTDPLYYRPLLPVITIKNTANNATLYTYNSFTDSGTTDKVIYCSVNLSQNTHGEFVVQFEDQNKSLESTVTVGSRVQIDCGKQSGSLTRLISGLVRKKGYARGANNKVLYTIQGSSTGIRLNERITYAVSEATKLPDGVTIDTSDASRKADTLLATNLSVLTSDGILSIANLAANSDVETFIASLSIEYGELQDVVNYIEDQSGGEVLVDTTDLVNFRYELKNNLTGRGFTLKNDNVDKATDDADDTMYLLNKNWNYDDDFYKSSAYANRLFAILPAQNKPGDRIELGYTISPSSLDQADLDTQIAVKFRPTHTRHFASDFMYVGGLWSSGAADIPPAIQSIFICKDNAGIPLNTSGIVAIIQFLPDQFTDPIPTLVDDSLYQIHIGDAVGNISDSTIGQTYLDVTKDYWMIWDKVPQTNVRLILGKNSLATGANYRFNNGPNYAAGTSGGSSWSALTAGTVAIGVGNYRSQSFVMWDPKGVQAVSSGLTAGQYVDSVLSDLGTQVTTKESMYRHLSNQLYVTPKPRTSFTFPSVSAPNIPPFPGDPIVISDSILDLSTAGSQVVIGTCGDMSYQWGNQGTGSYEAPTKLNLNVISVSPRYR